MLVDVDGTVLSDEDSALYGRLLWDDGLIAEAFKYSEEHGSSIPADESLLDFFRKRSESLFLDLDAKEATQKRQTLLNVAAMWGAYVGSPIERQSLRFYFLEECIEGENPFVAGTYKNILAEVAKHALDKAEIRFGQKMSAVTCRSSGTGKASISTTDGKTEDFDEVVVTCPLGWLKRNKTAFKPVLEPRLAKAIDSIGYGCLDKVLSLH